MISKEGFFPGVLLMVSVNYKIRNFGLKIKTFFPHSAPPLAGNRNWKKGKVMLPSGPTLEGPGW